MSVCSCIYFCDFSLISFLLFVLFYSGFSDFCLFYFIIIFRVLFSTKKEKEGVDLDWKENREDLGVGGGKSIIRIYCKKHIFKKRKISFKLKCKTNQLTKIKRAPKL